MAVTWVAIFGLFETNDPGEWEVEVVDGGKCAKISHPNLEHIALVADALQNLGVMQQWAETRHLKALEAWTAMAARAAIGQ
jgi:hypothetical protein